jgi:hypothetical protein
MKKLFGMSLVALIMLFACENPAADSGQTPYKGLAEVKELVLSVELGQTEGTLFWTPPDAAGFTAVVISSDPPAGSLIEPRIIEKSTTDFAISGLEYGADYAVTVKALYTEGGLSAGLTENTGTILKLTSSLNELTDELKAMPPNTAANPYLIGPAWVSGTTDYGELLKGLKTAGRYVDLNLSASPMESVLGQINSYDGKKYVTAVTLPESVTAIAEHYPDSTGSDGYYKYAGVFGVEKVGNGGYEEQGGYYTTTIFDGYISLKKVEMPGVINIGDSAFFRCTELESVSAPLAETIGYGAFDHCAALTSISFPEAKSIGRHIRSDKTIYSTGFVFCEKLEKVYLPKAEIIGDGAFSSCTSLKSISLPEAVDIGRGVFGSCTALTDVDLPKAVTIGMEAFIYCSALKTITLPKAESIGPNTFFGCSSLESISLPSLTEFTGGSQFRWTYSLKSITFGQTIPVEGLSPASFQSAGGQSGGFTIYVPTSDAETELKGYISDEDSLWHKAIYNSPVNYQNPVEMKFNGVKGPTSG